MTSKKNIIKYKIRTKQRTHYCCVYMADTFQAFPLPDIFIWKRAMKFWGRVGILNLSILLDPWPGKKMKISN